MRIDIYTFAIVLGITHTIQFVIFLLEYFSHKDYKGPGWWVLWCGSSILGFVFMQTRQIESIEHLSIFGQNVMFILASFFVYIGVIRFLEKEERRILLYIIFALFLMPFSYYTFIIDDIQNRTIIIWTTVFFITAISTLDLYLYRPKSENWAVWIIILVFFGHAIFALSKVIMLLGGSRIPTMNAQVWLNISTYMELLLVTIFWTYALIMMINQRLATDMKRARDHFEIIFNTTPDAIMISDLETSRIVSVNARFQDLTGYLPSEVIGKTSLEIKCWSDLNNRSYFLNEIRHKGYCIDYEAQFVLKNQETRTGLMSSRVINLNEHDHLISIIRDISARKSREQEIVKQNEQLQLLNNEKDKFFSIISHDLKSPFNSFLGLTEIMAEEIHKLPISEVISLAAKMRNSARNLYGLLENLLEWSLIRQGVTKFNPGQIDLMAEISECMTTYSDASLRKRIKMDVIVDPNAIVWADQNMFRSLIRNLLSNAIKFTEEGGTISISASNNPDSNYCQIAVRDSGIGMSNEMIRQLFKIDASTSRKGTNGELSCGLGLLLCKEYVSMHMGTIWVESKEGEGSTFFVTLPNQSA